MLLLASLAPRGYTAAEVSKRAGTTLVTVLGDPSSEPRLLGKVLARSGASAVVGAVCDDDELRCYIVDDPVFFAQTCASGGGEWRDRWPCDVPNAYDRVLNLEAATAKLLLHWDLLLALPVDSYIVVFPRADGKYAPLPDRLLMYGGYPTGTTPGARELAQSEGFSPKNVRLLLRPAAWRFLTMRVYLAMGLTAA